MSNTDFLSKHERAAIVDLYAVCEWKPKRIAKAFGLPREDIKKVLAEEAKCDDGCCY